MGLELPRRSRHDLRRLCGEIRVAHIQRLSWAGDYCKDTSAAQQPPFTLLSPADRFRGLHDLPQSVGARVLVLALPLFGSTALPTCKGGQVLTSRYPEGEGSGQAVQHAALLSEVRHVPGGWLAAGVRVG
jgi:hypothetical protein